MTAPAIPTFPTDSLYKFQAIAGVVLVIAAGWFAYGETERLYSGLVAQGEDLAQLQADREQFAMIDSLAALKFHGLGEVMTFKEWWERRYDVHRRVAVAQARVEANKARIATVRQDKNLSLWVMVFGLAMAIRGFWRWGRIQNYQDEILKLQLEQMRRSVAEAPRSVGPPTASEC